jgi:ferritin
MITKRMEDALNEQIKNELYSSYLYLAMAAWFNDKNLNGFSHWMRMQAKEEDLHAMKFYDYVLDQGARVDLRAIEGPPMDFASVSGVFEKTLEHERKVTALIHNLVNIAREEKDVATEIFLQWFVTEQVEEEATADEILQQVKLVKESGSGLLMIDRQLATRVFTPPPAGGAGA